MKKIIFYTAGAIILVILAIVIYRANQPVQPEPNTDWTGIISSRGLQRETFFVENGNIALEAELIQSATGLEEKPAVIFIPGSGSTTYQAYAPGLIEKYVLDIFIPRDYAVIFFKKRGMGQSEGNWMKNDFPGRAEDVLAVVDVIREHQGINPAQVGLIGHSQGGWIANLAASQDPGIAFFISLAGPVTSVQEQMADIYENDYRCQGFSGDELGKKVDRQLGLARFGATIGRVIRVGVIGFDSGIIQYNPREVILQTSNPGLFVYGEHDPYVPADQNIQRFNELFPGESENLKAIAIPEGDHHFRTTQSLCQPYEERLMEPFSELLVNEMNTWLDGLGF
jgi:pimeloyl-ACP methyl ester carboxylesterase